MTMGTAITALRVVLAGVAGRANRWSAASASGQSDTVAAGAKVLRSVVEKRTCDVGDDDGLLRQEGETEHAAVGDGEPGKTTCDV
jgi:hypothetical protein